MPARLRRLSFVALMTVLCLVFLTLSYWQIERLEWKRAILARFDQIATAPLMTPLTRADLTAVTPTAPVSGTLAGRADFCRSVFVVNKVQDGVVGKHLLTPFATSFGDVLVDFGWMPADASLPACRAQALTIQGVAVSPRANRFVPQGEVSPNHRAQPDFTGMIAPTLFLALHTRPAIQGVAPVPPTLETLRPRNNHLQYAIFWATMAALTAAMTALYLRKQS